jgi:hypothetical protein
MYAKRHGCKLLADGAHLPASRIDSATSLERVCDLSKDLGLHLSAKTSAIGAWVTALLLVVMPLV